MEEKKRKKSDAHGDSLLKKRKELDSHGDLANPLMEKQKSNEITELAKPQKRYNLRCLLKEKSPRQICRGKSNVEPSNNTTELVDRRKISNKNKESSDPCGDLATPLKQQRKKSDKKDNLISESKMETPKKRKKLHPNAKLLLKKQKANEITEPQKRYNFRCQLKEKSALSPHQICKGKSTVEPSSNTTELVDQRKIFNENTESSDPRRDLAIPLKQQQKKSNEKDKLINESKMVTPKKRKKLHPSANPLLKKQKSNEITSSITVLAKPQKFNLSRCQLNKNSALSPHQICKGKNVMEASSSTTEHMDVVDGIKENSSDPINITEIAMSEKFNLSRCQLKKQLYPYQICKGKSGLKPSKDICMDIGDQAIGIFPEEIIMEILSKLPVRSLHRFKCVSKFWMALISDPYFKKEHLNRAKNDINFHKLLAARMAPDKSEMYLRSSALSSVPQVEDEQELDSPWNLKPCYCFIFCSGDGLVLLGVHKRNKQHFDQHLLLWNPSTRESTVLPPPGHQLGEHLYGLGYDTSSNDYKIVAINLNHDNWRCGIYCKILALKSGTWRDCKYPAGISRKSGNMASVMDYLAFVHGAFHWLGYKGSPLTPIVLTFDISSEVFGEILLPDDFPSGGMLDCGVSVLGGKLCSYVASFHWSNNAISKLWIWEMKDYGVKESWTCLLTIPNTNMSLLAARPQYRYANGEVLLHCKSATTPDSNWFFWRTRGSFKLLPSELIVTQGIAYIESLISPKLHT